MPYTFLTGGARSGKSAAAERRGLASGTGVTVIATAEAGDDEMAARIVVIEQRDPCPGRLSKSLLLWRRQSGPWPRIGSSSSTV
jgi:hypothetical protein